MAAKKRTPTKKRELVPHNDSMDQDARLAPGEVGRIDKTVMAKTRLRELLGKPWDEDCVRDAYAAMGVLYFRKSEFRAELSRTFSELPSFFAKARSLERSIDGFKDGAFSAEAYQVLQKLQEARDLYDAIPDKGPKLTASKFRAFAGVRWMRWFGVHRDTEKQKRVRGIDESVWLVAYALEVVKGTPKQFADAYRKRRK